ncbi:MAG: hypothetical protein ACRD2W_08265 [Acidimicrobiales bacterium]
MRRLNVLLLVLAVVATAATACTASKLDPDADVALTGTIHDPDGKPLAGAKVVLVKEVDFGEAVFGLTFLAATLGTICLSEQAPAVCSKARRATTDDQGSYTFTLKGRDTQGAVGTASTFHLSTGDPAGGPSVSARFQIQKDVSVPTLRMWTPNLQLTTARTLRATWDQRDRSASERLVFRNSNTPSNSAGADVIWAAEGRSPFTVDPRVLEDAKGAAFVESDTSEDEDGTSFRLTYRSGRVEFATNAVPPSRNVPCSPDPCALTDGDLGPPPTAPPGRQETTVDLTRSSTPTLIVVRGCPAQCDVETSVDGLAWKVVGSGQDPFFTVTPILGTPVRFVKLKSVSDLNQVAEVSAWLA